MKNFDIILKTKLENPKVDIFCDTKAFSLQPEELQYFETEDGKKFAVSWSSNFFATEDPSLDLSDLCFDCKWEIAFIEDVKPYIRNDYKKICLSYYNNYYYKDGHYTVSKGDKYFHVYLMSIQDDWSEDRFNQYIALEGGNGQLTKEQREYYREFFRIVFHAKGQDYKTSYNRSK